MKENNADDLFRGRFNGNSDSTNRIKLPEKYIQTIDTYHQNRLVVLYEYSFREQNNIKVYPVIEVFPEDSYKESIEKRLKDESFLKKLITSAKTQRIEIDKKGRIMIPSEMREETGINKKTPVKILGNLESILIFERSVGEKFLINYKRHNISTY